MPGTRTGRCGWASHSSRRNRVPWAGTGGFARRGTTTSGDRPRAPSPSSIAGCPRCDNSSIARRAEGGGLRHRVPRNHARFNGLSHAYASSRAAELLDRSLDDLRHRELPPRRGASVCASERGRLVDTTMEFSPLEGLVMATRSGSVDPALVAHHQRPAACSRLYVGDVGAPRRPPWLWVPGSFLSATVSKPEGLCHPRQQVPVDHQLASRCRCRPGRAASGCSTIRSRPESAWFRPARPRRGSQGHFPVIAGMVDRVECGSH
jgi:hypothetical protein